MVTSLNGKSTKGSSQSPSSWASSEDQEFFRSVIEKNNLLVIGRKTYEAAKPAIKLSPGKLRVVVTHSPDEFREEEIKGQLEFSNESPQELVGRFEKNYSTMILLGGSELNSVFFKEKLIDEVWLTLEPKIFSDGRGLVGDAEIDVTLQLTTIKQLNKEGTLLLQYQVQ